MSKNTEYIDPRKSFKYSKENKSIFPFVAPFHTLRTPLKIHLQVHVRAQPSPDNVVIYNFYFSCANKQMKTHTHTWLSVPSLQSSTSMHNIEK